MTKQTFEGLTQTIKGLMEDGKRAIANNVYNAVRHTLTQEQRIEVGGIIKPRSIQSASTGATIDEKELFLQYGDDGQKKRIAAGRGTLSSDTESKTPELVAIQEVETIETVSPDWGNATRSAQNLAKKHTSADYSELIGVEKITLNDVKSLLKAQGYDI